MTVLELKAILAALPADMEVLVNHERTKLAPPELFLSTVSDTPFLAIVPTTTAAFEDAVERYYWKHLQAPE
jgi:hypothetical protein